MNDQSVKVYAKMHLPMSAEDVSDQVQAIQQIMSRVMKPDVHYGVIPGTGKNAKPTLLKAGAEALLSAFRIAVDPQIEDLSTEDEIRYRVKARGIHMMTDTLVGVGVGTASSREEKYAWQGATDTEYEATETKNRRIKYGSKWHPTNRGERIETQIKQVRTNPADKENTILKMAKKRAQIDLCLTALAASDCFSQDLEDPHTLGEGAQPPAHPKAASAPPQARSNGNGGGGGPGKISEAQCRLLRVKCDDAGVNEIDLVAHFHLTELEQMQASEVNSALAWLKAIHEPPTA